MATALALPSPPSISCIPSLGYSHTSAPPSPSSPTLPSPTSATFYLPSSSLPAPPSPLAESSPMPNPPSLTFIASSSNSSLPAPPSQPSLQNSPSFPLSPSSSNSSQPPLIDYLSSLGLTPLSIPSDLTTPPPLHTPPLSHSRPHPLLHQNSLSSIPIPSPLPSSLRRLSLSAVPPPQSSDPSPLRRLSLALPSASSPSLLTSHSPSPLSSLPPPSPSAASSLSSLSLSTAKSFSSITSSSFPTAEGSPGLRRSRKEKKEKKYLEEVGPGFWSLRGKGLGAGGLIDIGNHMSFLQLPNNKFLVIDTIVLKPKMKEAIDKLTNHGLDIEAVVATHPFHTLGFRAFYNSYPNVPYYGTPRHLRVIPEIPWEGSVTECEVKGKWWPFVDMRIPAGAEFVNPMPEDRNHFSSLFVFHSLSRTIHVTDTIMIGSRPGLLLKLGGYRHGSMGFHPSIKGVGLHPTPEAPFLFKTFIKEIIKEWDFDNICAAHMGNKIGGAKEQLKEVLAKAEPLFEKLKERNMKKHDAIADTIKINIEGNECG